MNTVLIQRLESPNGSRVHHAEGTSKWILQRQEGSGIKDVLPRGNKLHDAKQIHSLAASSRKRTQSHNHPFLYNSSSRDKLNMQVSSGTHKLMVQKRKTKHSNSIETCQAKNFFNISSHKIFKSVSALVLKWH